MASAQSVDFSTLIEGSEKYGIDLSMENDFIGFDDFIFGFSILKDDSDSVLRAAFLFTFSNLLNTYVNLHDFVAYNLFFENVRHSTKLEIF